MAGLRELIKKIEKSRDYRKDSRIIRSQIDHLKNYCSARDYDFYPLMADDEISEFSGPIEEKIRARAREGLPKSHFDKKHAKKDITDYLEVAGIIGYNPLSGSTHEIVYRCPICEDPRVYDNSLDIIADLAEQGNFSPAHSDVIVGWHSQNYGIGELTMGDLDNVKEILDIKNSWPYYHVIYVPRNDFFSWYKFNEISLAERNQEPDEWIDFSTGEDTLRQQKIYKLFF